MARNLKTKIASPISLPTKVSLGEGQRTLIIMVVLGVLVLGALSTAGYFYYQYRNLATVKDAREIEELTKAIGKLMLLPSTETPTLATVTDKEKLIDQPFFAKAENDDKVLIYSQSGRAILYRPSLKKIVDISTVNVTPPVGATPPMETTSQAPVSLAIRVAIYNGSGEGNAGANLEKQIHGLYPDITFPATTEATHQYEDSRVIDLTGKNAVMSQAFANLVKGTIRTLPDGEQAPANADVLIIIGKTH